MEILRNYSKKSVNTVPMRRKTVVHGKKINILKNQNIYTS